MIIIVTPKGTGKSEQFVRKNLHDLENNKLKYGVLNIKTVAASSKAMPCFFMQGWGCFSRKIDEPSFFRFHDPKMHPVTGPSF